MGTLQSGDALVPISETVLDSEAPGFVPKRVAGDGAHEAGAAIGRYVVLGTLGEGAMGTVYAAYDPKLDRQVALKLLRPDARDPEGGRVRLQREAQALARLSHPNVVGVHDVGAHDEQVFVAMEFVRGQTFREWLADPHPWQQVLRMLVEAGRGLAAAHAAGLVHRDFKPDNVMVEASGRMRVMDFGLARADGSLEPARDDDVPLAVNTESNVSVERTGDRALESDLTRTGTIMGTPAYMAPEQHAGLPADARCDQFSFAVTCFEALYGERPFAGRTLAELMMRVGQGEVRSVPGNHPVPAWVHKVLLRGLRAEPDARWPDMRAMLDALEQEGHRRKRGWVAFGVLAIAGLGAFAALWASSSAEEATPCTAGGAKVGAVWGREQKGRVLTALRSSNNAYGARAADAVEASLDDYTKRWAAAYTDACEATRIRGDQSEALMDLRMACLDRQLDQVRAVVAVLGGSDEGLAQHAVQTVTQLRPIEACADTEALQARVPPPTDPERRRRVRELQAELERARVLEYAGRYVEGRQLAEALVAEADAIGYQPLQGEAQYRLGSILAWTESMDETLPPTFEGYYDALASGDDAMAAEAASVIAFVLSEHGEIEAAWRWQRSAEALVERLDDPAEKRAWVQNIRGTVHSSAGEPELAEVALAKAIELWTPAIGPDHVYIAAAWDNLAGALADQDKLDEAEAAHRKAWAMLERLLGPDHPHIGYTLAGLGDVQRRRGDAARSEASFRRSIDILSQAYGEDHHVTLGSHAELARLLADLDRTDEALALYDRVLGVASYTDRAGPASEVYADRGLLRAERGDRDGAESDLERAIELAVFDDQRSDYEAELKSLRAEPASR